MGRSWQRCCAISGLVTAVVCAILALTFPLLYHAILNYVSIFVLSHPIFILFIFFLLTECFVGTGIVSTKGDNVIQNVGRASSENVHQILFL
jgi:uncharacterized protein YacL